MNPQLEVFMSGFTYLHILEGRIRVKLPLLKGSPEKAGQLEKAIFNLKGIDDVKANHKTGSLLIYYNSNVISQPRVLEAVETVIRVEKQNVIPVARFSSDYNNPYIEIYFTKSRGIRS